MSNSEDNSVIKYGDIVKLICEDTSLLSKGLTFKGLSWEEQIDDQSLCAFKILPKSINLIQNKVLKNYKDGKTDQDSVNLESLRLEIMNNMHHHSKAVRSPVSIGSSVELQHLMTNKYLGVELEVSRSSANEYWKFKLKDNPDETCVIRLESVFNFQKEKSTIMNGDKVYFEVLISRLNGPIYLYKQHKKAFASFDNKSRIELSLQCSDPESDSNQIFSWNYVFIKDSENNLSLSVSDNDTDNSVFFTKDIELHNSLWRIEDDTLCGIVPGGSYKIKHITHKKYLNISLKTHRKSSLFQNITSSVNPKRENNYQIELDDYDCEFNDWKIIPINFTDSKYIKSQYCKIVSGIRDNLYMSMDYMQLEKIYLCLDEKETDSIYFQIFKCNDDVCIDVAYANEIIIRLHREIHLVHDKVQIKDFKALKKILRVVDDFLFNRNFSIAYENGVIGQVSKTRQDILSAQKIFDIFMRILEEFEKSNELNDSIIDDIFEIIEKLCIDNTKNKFEVLKISCVIQHFIIAEKNRSGYLVNILKNFYEGNQKYRDSIESLVKVHVGLLKSTWNENIVNFLLTTSVCDGQGVAYIQDLIINSILRDEIYIKLPKIEGNSFIFEFRKSVSLESCFKNRKLVENKKQISKFCSFLKLLSYLCEGRNYNCINIASAWFPFGILFDYAKNDEISSELRALFLNLICKLHIDISPRYPIDLPEYVIYYQINQNGLEIVPNNKVSPLLSLRSLDSLSLMEYETKSFFNNFSEINIVPLKNYILEFFEKERQADPVIKLNVLRIINLMGRLKLLRSSKSNENDGLPKVLNTLAETIKSDSIFTLLKHIPISHSNSNQEKNVESNFEFLRKSTTKKTAVLKFSTKIVKLFSNIKIDLKIEEDLSEDCITEILKSFSIYLDWRQNKILKKIFANPLLVEDSSRCLNFIPPVIKKDRKNSSFSLITEALLKKLLQYLTSASKFEVKNLALSIFIRSCFVVRETVKNIEKIEFLKNTNDIDVHKFLKKQKSMFVEIAENSESWLEDSKSEIYDEFLKMLEDFSILLSKDSYIMNKVIGNKDEPPSTLRQNIFFNLKFHVVLIKFINETNHKINENFRLQKIFKQIYKILTRIIMNNKPKQDYFIKYLKYFKFDLHLDLGQVEVICEVFKNNYELCSSADTIFFSIFKECIIAYGRKARFLQFFETIQIVNNEALFDVQLKVLNCLLDRDYYRKLCYCEGILEVDFVFKEEMEGDEPIKYHAQLFKVLSLSTVGIVEVEINESKCKKIIPIKKLFELLELADTNKDFEILGEPLLEIFHEVYLDSKQRLPFTEYYDGLVRLVDRTIINLPSLNSKKVALIVKILRKYSELYLLTPNMSSKLSNDVSKLFDELYQNRHKFNNLKDFDLSINLDKLGYIFKKGFTLTEENFSEFVNEEPNEIEMLKQNLRSNPEFKEILKKERFSIAEIISAGDENEPYMRKVLDELLQIIKFYKQKKIPKRTVFLSIIIIKTLIVESKTAIECRRELEKLNGLNVILDILSEKDTESKIFNKLLVILIKVLKPIAIDKGDENCEERDSDTSETQNFFYNHFTNSQESEIFFKTLSDILTRFCITSKEINILSFKPVNRTLEFIKYLCENHNTNLQKYFRVQEKSLISYNFINEILVLLEKLISSKDILVHKTAELCFDTLTEMCQGPCKDNQKAVIDSNFMFIINDLLGIDESKENLLPFQSFSQATVSKSKSSNMLKEWMVINLKHKALITLHSLLEGNEDKYIVSKMIRMINIETLNKNLIVIHQNWINKQKPSNSNELINADKLGILIYHLLRVFQDNPTKENYNVVKTFLPVIEFDNGDINYLGKEADTNKKKDLIEKEIIKVNKSNKVSPEVKEGEENGEKKQFEAAAAYFEEHTGNIDIVLPSNILCKIYFWLDPQCDRLSEEMKFDFHFNADRSSEKSKLEYMLSRVDDIKDHIEHEYKLSNLVSNNRIGELVSNILIWKILAFLSAIIIFALTLIYYEPEDSQSLILNKVKMAAKYQGFYACEVVHLISSILIVIFYYLKNVPVLFKKGKRQKVPFFKNNFFFQALYVYMNLETIYVNLYLVFSVLGCFYHVFFFAFHLLDFLYLFPSLQSVILSVIKPRKQIALVFFFILIVMYILTLISYIYFSDWFLGNCDSLLLCTYVSIIEGIKNSGGVGYYTYWNDPYTGQLRFWLFIYDNVNNIVLFIILWNILTGIIINAFSVIRGENETNSEDQQNICFICGMMKNEIEEVSKKPFKFHRRYEHNEWYYVFFIIYLENKNPTERSGIESIVKKELKSNSTSWIPQGKGFSIDKIRTQ